MSYANGIANLQHATNAIAPSEVKNNVQVSALDNDVIDQSEVSSASVGHADQTRLSSTAGVVAQALEGSDARSTEVAALQSAIASGTYNISSSDVADKIIQSLLD
jgi:negative regulator of flagellin synthesis FlgM